MVARKTSPPRGIRILGIDPGTLVAGYGCLELPVVEPQPSSTRPLALAASNVIGRAGAGRGMRIVAAGALRLGTSKTPIYRRLHKLQEALVGLLEELQADELALEEAFAGKSVGAALRIGEARGVILANACAHSLAVHQYAPARIKRAVAGAGSASKEQVADMVCRQLALSEIPTPHDVTDALAAAYCRAEQRRSLLDHC